MKARPVRLRRDVPSRFAEKLLALDEARADALARSGMSPGEVEDAMTLHRKEWRRKHLRQAWEPFNP